jgi:flagellar biosynthesis/type III secretory pathway protein FliH
MKTMEELPKKKKDGVPGTFWGIPDFFSLSEDEQVRYERQIKAEVDRRCILDSAERKGIAKGKAEGLAEGEAIGIAKGEAKEHVKVVASARFMKSLGVSIDDIKQHTGLTEEEINAL